MLERIWADESTFPVADRGLAYGDGLFETIRFNGRQANLRDRHLRRLTNDAGRLGIPASREALASALDAAVDRYATPGSWVLKLILTRGSGGRGYRPPASAHPRLCLSRHECPPSPAQPVAVSRCPNPLVVDPQLAGIKSLNRLPQVLASQTMPEWAYEALMGSPNGDLLEGTRTNLIARVGDHWVTPAVDTLAVAGVARQAALDELARLGESVQLRAITRVDIHDSDFGGLMLMNSVVGGIMVGWIDQFELPRHEALARIRSFLSDAVGS
ncbi:aminotransferase class IV [Marinobacter halodurans]|uniref:aminotransferase class IV n=1 Tax=Marinobacter halodurans TaxID=2528979 RepID=UPI0013F17C8C|nr:aminotransferase class IV [Marinobacter halodurans]